MCSTTFLTTLDRILKLLMELVNAEMQTCTPRLDVSNTNYVTPTSKVSNRSKVICSYCHKRGHVSRRCYHATQACFECGSVDHFVKDCNFKRAISSLTDPFPNTSSFSEICSSSVLGRKRSSSKLSHSTYGRKYNRGRPCLSSNNLCNNFERKHIGTASESINSQLVEYLILILL